MYLDVFLDQNCMPFHAPAGVPELEDVPSYVLHMHQNCIPFHAPADVPALEDVPSYVLDKVPGNT